MRLRLLCLYRTKLKQISAANRAKLERSLELLAVKLQHQSRPPATACPQNGASLSLPFELAVRAASFLLQHSLAQRVRIGKHRSSHGMLGGRNSCCHRIYHSKAVRKVVVRQSLPRWYTLSTHMHHSLNLKLDTSAVVVKKLYGAKINMNRESSAGSTSAITSPSANGSAVWRGVMLAVHPVDRQTLEQALATTPNTKVPRG